MCLITKEDDKEAWYIGLSQLDSLTHFSHVLYMVLKEALDVWDEYSGKEGVDLDDKLIYSLDMTISEVRLCRDSLVYDQLRHSKQSTQAN